MRCPRIGLDGHNHPANPCAVCNGTSTASDLAVQRIKEHAEMRCRWWHHTAGPEIAQEMRIILDIIREEEANGAAER